MNIKAAVSELTSTLYVGRIYYVFFHLVLSRCVWKQIHSKKDSLTRKNTLRSGLHSVSESKSAAEI